MAYLERPLVVASDTHLGVHTRSELVADLERLITASAGAEIVLAGDVFDLSLEPKPRDPAATIGALLQRFPSLCATFRVHLRRGGRLTLLPGNHDESTAEPEARGAILARLELGSGADVETAAWFVRRNGIHIEHGHLYDPDNAPAHPLARWSPRTEPLGVALTRRFIATTGAFAFAHAHESTPVQALSNAFRVYGLRAPSMIARYFQTAIALCLEADEERQQAAERERAAGAVQLTEFSRRTAVATHRVRALLAAAPTPTHLSRRDLFMRLYFDRVIASILAGVGGLASLTGSRVGLGLTASAVAYLVSSVPKQKSRYTGLPEARLRDAAAVVRELTSADLVVFGHTHREDAAPGYFNAGSFTFSRGQGRPFVHVTEAGVASQRRHSEL